MNVLKESGNRLRRKDSISFTISALLFVGLFALGLTTDPYLPIAVDWGNYTNFYALFIFALAFGAVYFYRRYQNFKQGYEGESRVASYLRSNFGDDHFLIDDLVYVNDNGHKENIDHIVLRRDGFFVLETKDYRGRIVCKGSFWTVPFPYGRSPSKQAMGNAYWVKKSIDETGILPDLNVWVEPIVVFSNPDVELETRDTETEVVKLGDLAKSMSILGRGYNLSNSQLKTVGEKILEKSVSD